MSDAELIQIAGAALGDAYTRAGDWMACRPGCHACCVGVFPISRLDAERLRVGLAAAEAGVAGRVRARAVAAWGRLRREFPGDVWTGTLFTEDRHEGEFEEFANDEPCPVLDPVTGTCDLYAARPMPCRTFGPPMPNEESGLAVCELCFVEAPEIEVARCAVDVEFLAVEEQVVAEFEGRVGVQGMTLVAFALGG